MQKQKDLNAGYVYQFTYSKIATEFATRLGIPSRGPVREDYSMCEKINISQFANNAQIPVTNKPTCSSVTEDSVLMFKCGSADSEQTDFIEFELDQRCVDFEAQIGHALLNLMS